MTYIASAISMSLDGFVTAAGNDRAHPLGVDGERLFRWLMPPMAESDSVFLESAIARCGALIMGRRSYDTFEGSDTGPLGKVPVFVLTHNPPPSETVAAPDVFRFVTDGIESAVAQASKAAGDHNVVALHGATPVQQALRAGLVDEITVHVVPVLLGAGTRLFDHLADLRVELERFQVIESPEVTHLRFRVVK
ncbi:dihydrofolate reductase family protein [Streptomyces sp. NPDC050564]|uniref:dihydrofolate reductase family protein n=1 Tax=Streptomyces sp. NPDC050564 TaxID=3365631 RepID=UPI0037BB0C54